jgi:hypothetical protein
MNRLGVSYLDTQATQLDRVCTTFYWPKSRNNGPLFSAFNTTRSIF